MARTYTISGSLVTITGDPFDEGKDDYLEYDLVDENEDPILANAVVAIVATLRNLDDASICTIGSIINGREIQNVFNQNGGTLTDGTFRLDLTGGSDLAAFGSHTNQRRELTILFTHSVDKTIPIVTRFTVRTFADVG